MEKIGKKLKHDHTLTSILKFAIFSMVMLAPIFSVASRCLYVICNKNAKDSYSSRNIDEYSATYLEIDSEINPTQAYYINTYNVELDQNTVYNLYISDLELVDYGSLTTSNINTFQANKNLVQRIQPNYNGTQISWDFYGRNNDNSFLWLFNLKSQENIQWTMSFTLNNVQNFPLTDIYYINYVYDLTLDNAFEYSLSQLEESEYYNWTTNLGIYTPINNMVSGLGGHSVISLLLAYWSIYTAIYIVFDIIITCFVKITHLIQGE